ncbi:MAG: hypothetical protein GXO79_03835 [Chlorobi bacterium]|nr:hypothetical protein [Chlorobiota bacterium]
MKKVISLTLILFTFIAIQAQDDDFKTIFGDEEFTISGFGGPFMSFNTIAGNFAHMMGGGGGVILNNKVLFGGYGIGKTTRTPLNPNKINDTVFTQNYAGRISNLEIDFGHGGLFAGYVFNGNAAIHPTFILQFGWGTVSVSDSETFPVLNDNIFVLNPILELEMNVTHFLRVGIGADYTLVTGVNTLGYNDGDFSSPGAFLSFKFGWF